MTVVLVVGACLAAPAHADPKEEAAAHFKKGVALFQRGDFEAALAEFQTAQSLSPNPKVLFNIGLTAKRLFRYGEALAALEEYLRAVPSITAEHRKRVEKEIDDVRDLVGALQLSVPRPKGASVAIDGKLVGRAPYQGTLWLRPGPHTIRVERAGHVSQEKSLVIVSRGEFKETIALVPATSTLSITSRPSGATVIVDGEAKGKTPWRGTLRPGGHNVQLSHPGYLAVSREVVLSPEQLRPLEVTLKAKDTPIYKRWPFWLTVGATAAVGTATTLYFVNRDSGGPDESLVAR